MNSLLRFMKKYTASREQAVEAKMPQAIDIASTSLRKNGLILFAPVSVNASFNSMPCSCKRSVKSLGFRWWFPEAVTGLVDAMGVDVANRFQPHGVDNGERGGKADA
jgi:hypothetical protein